MEREKRKEGVRSVSSGVKGWNEGRIKDASGQKRNECKEERMRGKVLLRESMDEHEECRKENHGREESTDDADIGK